MGKTRNSSDFLARRGCSLQTHHFQHLRHWLPSWGRPALQCQVSCETKTSIQQQSCGQKKKKKTLSICWKGCVNNLGGIYASVFLWYPGFSLLSAHAISLLKCLHRSAVSVLGHLNVFPLSIKRDTDISPLFFDSSCAENVFFTSWLDTVIAMYHTLFYDIARQ